MRCAPRGSVGRSCSGAAGYALVFANQSTDGGGLLIACGAAAVIIIWFRRPLAAPGQGIRGRNFLPFGVLELLLCWRFFQCLTPAQGNDPL